MMKLHYLSCIMLAILVFTSMEADVEGGGRCIMVMDPAACNLPSCKQQCLQAKNGNGVCISNIKEGYHCACYYNC
ncbi:hypothetical protein H6P81_012765 [Aristolochia fimbriata]|uniref:Uncharacterized protein n=1 Tax=Aristolochia fimbriata TaxID=158543 RepID=A0AAV7EGD1_ARIFI|nr:hypothetical protein H6P81_012765 [Aristolochia fimbriata]